MILTHLPDRVHFLWQTNDHRPTKPVQTVDRWMSLSTNIAGPDHFYQSGRNSIQPHTMRSPDPNTNQPICVRCKIVLGIWAGISFDCARTRSTFESLTVMLFQLHQTANEYGQCFAVVRIRFQNSAKKKSNFSHEGFNSYISSTYLSSTLMHFL